MPLYHFRTVTVAIITFFLTPLHALKETELSPDDLSRCLVPTYTISVPSLEHTQADISFGIADLKYDHGAFKIIECGNAPYCGLKPHPLFINNKEHVQTTPYWHIVAHVLKNYGLPVWFVGLPPFQPFSIFLQPSITRAFSMFTDLTAMSCFAEKGLTPKDTKPKKINAHEEIVVFRAKNRFQQTDPALLRFEQNQPGMLLVNAKSTPYFFSKDATYKLFEDAGLSAYVPKYKAYKTGYTPSLAAEIRADLAPHQTFVIKPLNQSRAIGVSFVAAANLDAHLQRMFGTEKLAAHENKTFGYWRTTTDQQFLVTEFVSSQKVDHQEKVYEPTMRIVFLMSHEEGVIAVNIIGGCWKNPPCSLDQVNANSLTERYITNPDRHETDDGILIPAHDLATMKAVVAPVLAQMYKTMLLQA